MYTSFSQFTPSLISNAAHKGADQPGHAAFIANTSAGDAVVVSEFAGSHKMIAGDNSPVPGDPGVNYANLQFGTLNINAAGDYLIGGALIGPSIGSDNDYGQFYVDGADWSGGKVMQRGDTPPGVTDTLDFASNLRLAAGGTAGFSTILQPSGSTAFYTTRVTGGVTEQLKPVALQGEVLPNGDTVDFIYGLTLNDSSVVFGRDRTIADTNEVVTELMHLSLESVEPIQIAATGDAAPEVAPGATINQVGLQVHINGERILAYRARVEITLDEFVDSVFAANTDTHVKRAVATTGESAPGLDPSVLTSIQTMAINAQGRLAIVADASTPTPQSPVAEGAEPITDTVGIWYENDDLELTLAAYSGQQVPDGPAGLCLLSPSFPSFNALNQVAFSAGLDGPGVDFSNDSAVFVTDTSGALHTVVREGDVFDVDDDPESEDLRTVSMIVAPARSGGDDGLGTSLNDSGQLVLTIFFTDFTSGVFVFDTTLLGESLDGDYNADGVVDAADYAVWRDNIGAPAGTLDNDPNTGAIGQAQYDTWRANYGSSLSAADANAHAVPEPGGVLLIVAGAATLLRRRAPATLTALARYRLRS